MALSLNSRMRIPHAAGTDREQERIAGRKNESRTRARARAFNSDADDVRTGNSTRQRGGPTRGNLQGGARF